MMEWIKLTPENTPEHNQWVFVTYWNQSGNHTEYARYDEYYGKFSISKEFEAGKFYGLDTVRNVTHWAPLPEPAEDEECRKRWKHMCEETKKPRYKEHKLGEIIFTTDERPTWLDELMMMEM